jgi:hypothetical protein
MSYQDIGALILIEIVGDFWFQKFVNEGGIAPFLTDVGSLV